MSEIGGGRSEVGGGSEVSNSEVSEAPAAETGGDASEATQEAANEQANESGGFENDETETTMEDDESDEDDSNMDEESDESQDVGFEGPEGVDNTDDNPEDSDIDNNEETEMSDEDKVGFDDEEEFDAEESVEEENSTDEIDPLNDDTDSSEQEDYLDDEDNIEDNDDSEDEDLLEEDTGEPEEYSDEPEEQTEDTDAELEDNEADEDGDPDGDRLDAQYEEDEAEDDEYIEDEYDEEEDPGDIEQYTEDADEREEDTSETDEADNEEDEDTERELEEKNEEAAEQVEQEAIDNNAEENVKNETEIAEDENKKVAENVPDADEVTADNNDSSLDDQVVEETSDVESPEQDNDNSDLEEDFDEDEEDDFDEGELEEYGEDEQSAEQNDTKAENADVDVENSHVEQKSKFADNSEGEDAYEKAMSNMTEYMSEHNYGPDDYAQYSQDPEWRKLNNDLRRSMGEDMPEEPASSEAKVDEATALSNMANYMNEHNYGLDDYEEYSKDPEWQKLNADLLQSMGMETPTEQSSETSDSENVDNKVVISDETRECLSSFEQGNWDKLSQAEKEQAVENLRDSVANDLDIQDKPKVGYYNNRDPGDFGGYAASTNTIYINRFNMGDAREIADTIAHESRHCWQHERADDPQTEQDYQFKENFDNYTRPEENFDEYLNQPVEKDARDYADAVKKQIPEDTQQNNYKVDTASNSQHDGYSESNPRAPPEADYQNKNVSELPDDFEAKQNNAERKKVTDANKQELREIGKGVYDNSSGPIESDFKGPYKILTEQEKSELASNAKELIDSKSKEQLGDFRVPTAEKIKGVREDGTIVEAWKLNTDGAVKGTRHMEIPTKGQIIDRIGEESGNYFSPMDKKGKPYSLESRAIGDYLPKENIGDNASYHAYEIQQDFTKENFQNAINNSNLEDADKEKMLKKLDAYYDDCADATAKDHAGDTYADNSSGADGVKTGKIAPMFKSDDGGGMQYITPFSVSELKDIGMIKDA